MSLRSQHDALKELMRLAKQNGWTGNRERQYWLYEPNDPSDPVAEPHMWVIQYSDDSGGGQLPVQFEEREDAELYAAMLTYVNARIHE